MDKTLQEALDLAGTLSQIPVTEIQHPTDLLSLDRYFELTYLLLLLRVLPDDIHLMSSKYWSEYDV